MSIHKQVLPIQCQNHNPSNPEKNSTHTILDLDLVVQRRARFRPRQHTVTELSLRLATRLSPSQRTPKAFV